MRSKNVRFSMMPINPTGKNLLYSYVKFFLPYSYVKFFGEGNLKIAACALCACAICAITAMLLMRHTCPMLAPFRCCVCSIERAPIV